MHKHPRAFSTRELHIHCECTMWVLQTEQGGEVLQNTIATDIEVSVTAPVAVIFGASLTERISYFIMAGKAHLVHEAAMVASQILR